MAAKLPKSMIRTEPKVYTVATMPTGQMMGADYSAMVVDKDLNCYLDPNEKVKDILTWIAILRDERGYHVTLNLSSLGWIPKDIPAKERDRLIPVESIAEKD